MSKTTKSDKSKADKKGKKAPKVARPKTVLKPVIIGATLLGIAQAVLPKVL